MCLTQGEKDLWENPHIVSDCVIKKSDKKTSITNQ